MLDRVRTVNLRQKTDKKYDREERLKKKRKKKKVMLAWLCVFLRGPFGGLLLIKLLLHDAPS